MEKSTIHEINGNSSTEIYLHEMFILYFSLIFKYDFHIDAERMIVRSQGMPRTFYVDGPNFFYFTA